MPKVVAQCGHPQNSAPISKLVSTRDDVSNSWVDIIFRRDDPKRTLRQFHYAERVLKPLVGRAGIHQVRQRQLMNMPKTLKRARIENLSLVRVEPSENMDGVPNFVDVFRHCSPPRSF